jgi:hypothetical protein
MVSFYWNVLVDPHLPSSTTFHIMVKFNSMGIHRCIVDQGESTSILSSSTWKSLGSPKLMSATSELLSFEKIHSEFLGFLPKFHITLGGNIILVYFLVVSGHLSFNMLLGNDYVYVMSVFVSIIHHVMHIPHNGLIVTIDHLSSNNHHPSLNLAQVSPLYAPSVQVESSL